MTHAIGCARFFVQGLPKAKGSKRAFVVRCKTGPKAVLAESAGEGLTEWMERVRAAADREGVPLTLGPMHLELHFVLPRPRAHLRSNGLPKPGAPTWHVNRPDLDKLVRAVKDALQGSLYVEDSQVAGLTARKTYPDADSFPGPRTGVWISAHDLARETAEACL